MLSWHRSISLSLPEEGLDLNSNSVKLPKLTFVSSILLITFFTNCSHPLIVGDWKPQQITFNSEGQEPVDIDLSDPDKLSNELFQASWDKYKANDLDSNSLKTSINNLTSNYQNIKLTIDADNQFIMNNYNLIVFTTIPGWHLSDTILGRWSLIQETLTLFVGKDMSMMDWKFKVVDLSSTILRIEEIYSNTKKEILLKRL